MSEQGVKSGQPGRQAPAAPKQGPVTLRAVTPEEIAVSIAAEMVLVRAQNRERAGREKPCTF